VDSPRNSPRNSTDDLDVVDLLTLQHEQIRTLFTTVESTRSDVQQRAFEELRRFLAVHETAEELVTHPHVRAAQGGRPVVDARLKEETEAKRLLADLDGMDVTDVTFTTKLAALKFAVLTHAEAEEREEFPILRATTDPDRLRRMATAVRAAEAVAPTHPHPSVGSSPAANLMAGPLASVLDRTRDAVRAALSRA
jgi:hemerythrin superfamily protein